MEVELIEYQPGYREQFISLNEAWLYKYELMEEIDRFILDHHEEYILDKGGYIFFAKHQEGIIGTFALIRKDEQTYELAKLAVDERFRGKKIGKMLCQKAIEIAKKNGAQRIDLITSSKLDSARYLYESLGFVQIPLSAEYEEYTTADIQMYLELV